jgi:hypothetical protein
LECHLSKMPVPATYIENRLGKFNGMIKSGLD